MHVGKFYPFIANQFFTLMQQNIFYSWQSEFIMMDFRPYKTGKFLPVMDSAEIFFACSDMLVRTPEHIFTRIFGKKLTVWLIFHFWPHKSVFEVEILKLSQLLNRLTDVGLQYLLLKLKMVGILDTFGLVWPPEA